MREFLIVSFLSSHPPEIFKRGHWPLHVTILRPFKTAMTKDELLALLAPLCAKQKRILTTGKSRETFKLHENDVMVTELELSPSLLSLHEEVAQTFESSGIEFSLPAFQDYRPHVTDQLSGSIGIGDTVAIDSLSLVAYDGDERRVVATLPLG